MFLVLSAATKLWLDGATPSRELRDGFEVHIREFELSLKFTPGI